MDTSTPGASCTTAVTAEPQFRIWHAHDVHVDHRVEQFQLLLDFLREHLLAAVIEIGAAVYDLAVPLLPRASGWMSAVAAVVAVLSPFVAFGLLTGFDRGAVVTRSGVRGESAQVADTLPAPPGCDRVIVIGDSLTAASASVLRTELAANGYDAYVDGAVNRRVPLALPVPLSGVRAALAARRSWGEAECWVVALGSNDISSGADRPSVANALIDEMLSAATPDATVWWVNVDHHNERTNSNLVAGTHSFNGTLAVRAAEDSKFFVIDWYSLAEANLQWFADAVHVNGSGSAARSKLIASSLFPSSR